MRGTKKTAELVVILVLMVGLVLPLSAPAAGVGTLNEVDAQIGAEFEGAITADTTRMGEESPHIDMSPSEDVPEQLSTPPCSCSPVLDVASAETSVSSGDWDSRPVAVNIQVNLEKEGEQEYVYKILNEIERRGCVTSVFVTWYFASKHPEVVSEIGERGVASGAWILTS